VLLPLEFFVQAANSGIDTGIPIIVEIKGFQEVTFMKIMTHLYGGGLGGLHTDIGANSESQ
jgi:hypothetical protein